MVKDELAFGVDFIKTYNWTSSGALKQIVSMAAKENVPITGHTPLSMSSIAAIDAGIQVLQHIRIRPYEVLDDLEIVARYPVDESLMKRTAFWAHFQPDGNAVRQTLAGWEKRKDKFFVTPTLVVQEAVAQSYDYPDPRFSENPDVQLLSPGALERWKKSSPPLHWGKLSAEEIAEAKASFEGMVAFIRLAHTRGIRILSGTDTPVPWLVPGTSLLQELRCFVEKAGMTPAEAVHTSTGRAAEALRVSDRGTIEPGKTADLVVLGGDLAIDISAFGKIEQVLLNGRIYGKDQLLKEAAGWAAQDRPETDNSADSR
ncbi:MAG: amidohydrolase family protein [Vicinamibacteria bacterium]